MSSEAQELRMYGRRYSQSKCVCAVSHGYGGLGGGRLEDVDGMNAGQRQEGWRCLSTSRVRDDTLTTSNLTAFQVCSSG